MNYKYTYETPANFSNMIMNSDGEYLTGLWFENSRDSSKHIIDCEEKDLEIFRETSKWLDTYFKGKKPDFMPKYNIKNLTPFRKDVVDIMNSIEYGKTLTYNDISKIIAKKRGIERMSAQAVGGAVGWNPICIIIPCHRVVGTNGNLTGYGGGIKNKIELLALEKNDMSKFFAPKQMEHVHSIILIKKDGKYLNYFDKRWNMYLFPNIKGNSIEEIKHKYNTDNVTFLFDKVHNKYSIPNKEMRTYHHYFYEVNADIEGEYFSLNELIDKENVKENNGDIIKFIEEFNNN